MKRRELKRERKNQIKEFKAQRQLQYSSKPISSATELTQEEIQHLIDISTSYGNYRDMRRDLEIARGIR